MPEEELNVCDPDHDDHVLAELRQIREELWADFDDDIPTMFRYLREQASKHPPERMFESAGGELVLAGKRARQHT